MSISTVNDSTLITALFQNLELLKQGDVNLLELEEELEQFELPEELDYAQFQDEFIQLAA